MRSRQVGAPAAFRHEASRVARPRRRPWRSPADNRASEPEDAHSAEVALTTGKSAQAAAAACAPAGTTPSASAGRPRSARTGSMRLGSTCVLRDDPAGAAAAAAGNGRPRSSRRRAGVSTCERVRRPARSRAAVPVSGDAERQREHAPHRRRARAARLEVERALLRVGRRRSTNARIRPSGGSDLERVLHHAAAGRSVLSCV